MDEYRPKDGPPAAPGEERTEASPALQSLGSRLQGLFREFDDARKPMEKEWLQSLRQFSGKYSPEEESKLKDNRSRVFIGLTRTKVVSAYSRIIDLLFQRGERFFSAEPTPVADLEPEVEVGIRQQALLDIMEESGGALYPDLVMQRRDEIRREAQKEVQREAQLRAADMEQEIDDQFVELKAEQKFKACIF